MSGPNTVGGSTPPVVPKQPEIAASKDIKAPNSIQGHSVSAKKTSFSESVLKRIRDAFDSIGTALAKVLFPKVKASALKSDAIKDDTFRIVDAALHKRIDKSGKQQSSPALRKLLSKEEIGKLDAELLKSKEAEYRSLQKLFHKKDGLELKDFMDNPAALNIVKKHAQKAFFSEQIAFLEAVKDYKNTTDPQARLEKAKLIYELRIKANSDEEVNINSQDKKAIGRRLADLKEGETPPDDLFDLANSSAGVMVLGNINTPAARSQMNQYLKDIENELPLRLRLR